MTVAYGDTIDDDDYLTREDSRQTKYDEYEPVDLFAGETFEDRMAVESKLCKQAYYDEPLGVVLASVAGEHFCLGRCTNGVPRDWYRGFLWSDTP